MIGLWVAAGLVVIAGFGALMFHLGVEAAWRDAQEKIDVIHWWIREQERERERQQEKEDRTRTELLMGLEGERDGQRHVHHGTPRDQR